MGKFRVSFSRSLRNLFVKGYIKAIDSNMELPRYSKGFFLTDKAYTEIKNNDVIQKITDSMINWQKEKDKKISNMFRI